MGGVDVAGGADGIEAHTADLVRLAGFLGRAAADTGGSAASLHAYLAEPGISLSAALDPAGLVAYESALFSALDGPTGLTALAIRCAGLDVALRAAAAEYRVADRLKTGALRALKANLLTPAAMLQGEVTLVRTRSPLKALEAVAATDPELVAMAMDSLGTAVVTALGPAAALEDGKPVVRRTGTDPAGDAGGPPRTIADLMTGLAHRNKQGSGATGIHRLVGKNGEVSWVVEVTGTKEWNPLPSSDVTSPATNVLAIQGRTTSYEQGVLQAMHDAGIKASDKVMMVGHSQGGMVAMNAAITAAATGTFTITHVVTAGSPIAHSSAKVPDRVQVLALENEGDYVPEFDGDENAPRPNVTTVDVHHDNHHNHDIEKSYVPGARDVDQSRNGSITAFLRSAEPFLTAQSMSTTGYQISREN